MQIYRAEDGETFQASTISSISYAVSARIPTCRAGKQNSGGHREVRCQYLNHMVDPQIVIPEGWAALSASSMT